MINSTRTSRITLSLGSNLPELEAKERISQAIGMLIEKNCIQIDECSDIYLSSSGYLNYIATGTSSMECGLLVETTKKIESALGRTKDMKTKGIVPIDIDVVIYGNEILRPKDYKSEYFEMGLRRLMPSNSF